MPINYRKLGQRVKMLRQNKRLSQERLAEIVGLTQHFISYIETGTKAISLDTIVDISNALNATPNDLLRDSLSSQEGQDFSQLLLDCSPEEATILTEATSSLKSILRKHKIK